jgi:hypothetical protein
MYSKYKGGGITRVAGGKWVGINSGNKGGEEEAENEANLTVVE